MNDWLKAISLWVALGVSVSVYYTTARHDGGGWPLPYPEGLAATLVHYFVRLAANEEVGWGLWFVFFPAAGVGWVSLLHVTSRFFGGRRANYSLTLVRFSVSALPIALAGAGLLFLAGRTSSGWSFDRMMEAGVYGTASLGWAWADEMYLAASLAGMAIQLRMSFTAFGAPWRKAILHYTVGLILLLVAACGFGAGVGWAHGMIGG